MKQYLQSMMYWNTQLEIDFIFILDYLDVKINGKMEKRTKDNPWKLKTPPLSSSYEMYVDDKDGEERIVCVVGSTTLYYKFQAITDLHAMLKKHGDWMLMGSKDQKAEAKEGTVEHWARSTDNPVGGWYGLRNGYKGRFGMYMPPLMEELGLCEIEHNKRNNRMRAI